jgi:hypothetical protein
MPATSEKQRKFMGAELGRKRKGESTETGMNEKQLEDFARKPKHGGMEYMGKGRKTHGDDK